MAKILILPVCLLILLSFSSIASSLLALLPLSNMVEESEMIIIGKVVKVKEPNKRHEELSFFRVTIKVEKVLKGNQDTKSIDVYFLPGMEDEPNFSLNDKSIFFIHGYQNEYRLVQSCAGKIDIKNGKAINIHIYNEAYNQKLDSFLHKIEEALKMNKKRKIDGR